MSAVDDLLKMMSESSARGLRLSAGVPARMIDVNGKAVDASSHALSRQEILQLVGPIIPEHARRRLPQETSVEFDHASQFGAFKVTVLRNGSEIAVSIIPDPNSAVASTPQAAPAPVAPMVPTPLAPQAPVVEVGAPAIDRLFRVMVEARASDLHLSSSMPPLVRKDGKIQPLEPNARPLTNDDMVALLDPITPAVNREDFARRNDTDFAYEIPGLAGSARMCSSTARVAARCSVSFPRRS